MDDASLSQGQNMEMDPNMMGGDPNMEMDPNMMGGDPNMGADPNAMGGQNPEGEESDDTASIINKLSDADKEAVRSYAESMLSRDEAQNGETQDQMMEQVIFSKKQLNMIKENFGPSQDELMKKNDRKELPKKQSSKIKNSPFSSPKFQ